MDFEEHKANATTSFEAVFVAIETRDEETYRLALANLLDSIVYAKIMELGHDD